MADQTGGLLQRSRPLSGPGAAGLKYDVMTALLVTSCHAEPVTARLALRLSLLLTARYNWPSQSVAIGQRELARLWNVTERTVKRDLHLMRARGWLRVTVPAARGRVARYAVDLPVLLRATVPHWDAVGPDFAARMTGAPEPSAAPSNVVPLHARPAPLPEPDDTPWPAAARRLSLEDPAVFAAWLSRLTVADWGQGVLVLAAEKPFVADYVRRNFSSRLIAAVLGVEPSCRDVKLR